MTRRNSYAKFLLKVLMGLIGLTMVYIVLYVWLLHHWYQFDETSSDALVNQLLRHQPVHKPQSAIDISYDPSSHKLYNVYQNKYILPHNPNEHIFDVSSISNLESYSMSLHNHYHALYTNQSHQRELFYYHKPKCIHQYDKIPMCFISECHDSNAYLHFEQRLTKLQPQIMSQTPETDDIPLPRQWTRYRANIMTDEPYQHLIYRPDNIRTLKGTRSTSCFVSHHHKFAFVHVLKSGGTSMSGFLCYALCNTTAVKQCNKDILRKISCKKIQKRYPDYFYFAIVRNPYNRMFSLWAHQMVKGIEKTINRLRKTPKRFEIKGTEQNKKLDIDQYSREELLILFAEFVSKKRLGVRRSSKKTGVSSDHYYEQHFWLFENVNNCPIVDFIAHLENIEYDIQYILNLINDNKVLIDYYIENGEYWKVNTYGSNLKQMLYNNSKNDDGLKINSLSDIFKVATNLSGINVKKLTSELYKVDFNLFGYDIDRIDNNLLVKHKQSAL